MSRTQNFLLKLCDTAMTLKYSQGHWKCYEWVTLNEQCHRAKIDIYYVHSVWENCNFKFLPNIDHYIHIFHLSQNKKQQKCKRERESDRDRQRQRDFFSSNYTLSNMFLYTHNYGWNNQHPRRKYWTQFQCKCNFFHMKKIHACLLEKKKMHRLTE